MKKFLLSTSLVALGFMAGPSAIAQSVPDWLKRLDVTVEGSDESKPTFSIETVQPLSQTPETLRNTVFFQGRLASRNGDETLNIGLGYRYLLADESLILGLNTFYDVTDENSHERYGIGAEAIGRYMTLRANFYEALSDKEAIVTGSVTTNEQALDGYDYEIETPVPFAPWMRFAASGFNWEAEDGLDDLDGERVSLSGNLTQEIAFEIGATDDNYNDDRGFAKLTLSLGGPLNNGASTTLADVQSGVMPAFMARDLKRHTLDKVKRQNDMIVQKSGGVVIGRTD